MNNKFNLKKRFAILIFAVLSFVFAFSGCSEISGNITNAVVGNAELSDDNLQVHFISVGQGDSELIKLPTGRKCTDRFGRYVCCRNFVELSQRTGC